MRIGIDIDDTITNTCEFMMKYVSDYFGLSEEYLVKNNIYYFNLPEELNNKKDFYLSTLEKNLLNIPLKEKAREVLNKLHEEGNEIIFITRRNKDEYREPVLSTKKQLDFYGIKYNKLICTKDKKKACLDEKIDIFIDDSMKNLNNVKDVVKKIYLFTSPYNKNFDISFKRVDNWLQVYELLKR